MGGNPPADGPDDPSARTATRPRTRRHRASIATEALSVIERRCSEPGLTLNTVAAEVFASRRTLQRALIEEAGLAFRDALQLARMRRARRLLMVGAKIGEAAEQAGYASRSEFTKAFKRHSGMKPSEFARRAREGSVAPRDG